MKSIEKILAIDPGKLKCGIAVVEQERVKLQEVVMRSQLISRLKTIIPKVDVVVLGDGTGSEIFKAELFSSFAGLKSKLVIVDEQFSTVEARALYWQKNPPKGWRKLLPVSMQTPPVAYDDYVAVILAQRYQKMLLEKGSEFSS